MYQQLQPDSVVSAECYRLPLVTDSRAVLLHRGGLKPAILYQIGRLRLSPLAPSARSHRHHSL